jgi:condensin complex subunit 2
MRALVRACVRACAQVDVRALKDLMWSSLVTTAAHHQRAEHAHVAQQPASSIAFGEVIQHVPEVSAAGARADVSVHMCFICLLHLANERGLVVTGREDLRGLTIGNVVVGGGGGGDDDAGGEDL